METTYSLQLFLGVVNLLRLLLHTHELVSGCSVHPGLHLLYLHLLLLFASPCILCGDVWSNLSLILTGTARSLISVLLFSCLHLAWCTCRAINDQ